MSVSRMFNADKRSPEKPIAFIEATTKEEADAFAKSIKIEDENTNLWAHAVAKEEYQ